MRLLSHEFGEGIADKKCYILSYLQQCYTDYTETHVDGLEQERRN